MIRYEIEKLLIDGTISAKDIPAYWNDHYKKYLGITVPNDVQGCLQDVHWSHGSFGYFATYSIGSLYAAQFYWTIHNQLPNIEGEIEKGFNLPVLQWLQKNIYNYGACYISEELCKNATGEPLNSKFFVDYAAKKYGPIYNF